MLQRSSRLGKAIAAFNWVFAVLFTVEIVIKVIALGLFSHKGAFLRNVWNVLDLVITFFTILALALPSVQAVRSFRAARPLRLLTKSSRTKYVPVLSKFRRKQRPNETDLPLPLSRTVVMAFFRALLPIGNILLIVCLIWLVFAILGVQLWKGTFYNCTDGIPCSLCSHSHGEQIRLRYALFATVRSWMLVERLYRASG